MAEKDEASSPPDPAGKSYTVPGVTVWFDVTRCQHFAECVRGLNDVFQPGRKPWIRPDLGDPTEIAAVIRRCPTGALHYRLDDGPAEQPAVPTKLRRLSAGPIMMRGDLEIRTGSKTIRDTRAIICGCGGTKNAPFCDGACEINESLGPRD